MQRLTNGMMNEVYLSSDRQTVLKIAGKRNANSFNSLEREAAAYTMLSQVLPNFTPQLILNKSPNWLIFEYFDGKAFPELYEDLDNDARHRIIFQLGRLLRQVHSIPVNNAPEQLAWPFSGANWYEKMMGSTYHLIEAILFHAPESQSWLNRCLSILQGTQACFADVRLSLIHGDYGGANILIQGDKLKVIDWEWSAIADRDYDIVRLLWLNKVQRSAHLWYTEAEKQTFFEGYGESLLNLIPESKIYWYECWFTLSYLLVRLFLKRYEEAKVLQKYLISILPDK